MKRTPLICTTAAAALVLAGPAAAAPAAVADTARTAPVSAAARADVDADAAASAALKHVPGTVESLDKDGAVWHVNVVGKDGVTNSELEVSTTGAVRQAHRNRDADSAGNAPLVGAKTTAAAAMRAALAAHPGTVVSVDWDDDDNGAAPHWNVEVKAKDGKTSHYDVTSTDGKVSVSSDDGGNDNDSDDDGDGDDGN
ncbi:PepSY domain-containing protein [Streptomyces sp. cmx-4-9]|uniref:PepSY domain-containing protein n=1 Tax=Streptomyces sp. cmx-4-9 TaxID=2790941 RepID=UPI0039811023